jgi:hypothetical protein
VSATPTPAQAVELALEARTRSVRQLQLATGLPVREVRAALAAMARQGKVRVRHGIAGPEVVPTGNN